MPRRLPLVLCLLIFAVVVAPDASARRILLANDDGLTSNLKAAFDALSAAGHDVIVAVPCRNQSGMGAALRHYGADGSALSEPCRNRAAIAGDPPEGLMTRPGFERDYHYVNGTPVVALLYGLDVLAQARWGTAPDLVVSGPNEGRNAGPGVTASGTIGIAQFASGRGIPSIAISAGGGTVDDDTLANSDSALVAGKLVELVAGLDSQSKGGRLLPSGVALNVNLPDRIAGAPWKLTRHGSYASVAIRFSTDRAGADGPLAGIAVVPQGNPPTAEQQNDEAAVSRSAISVTVMQPTFDHDAKVHDSMAILLSDLLAK